MGKNPITSDKPMKSTKPSSLKGNSGPSTKAYTPCDNLAKKLAKGAYDTKN